MGRIHNSYNKSNAGNVNLYDGGDIKGLQRSLAYGPMILLLYR